MPRSVLPSASAGPTRLRVKRGAALLAVGAVLASGAAFGSGIGVASADDAAADQCGDIVAADATGFRQINLVLDDSGTMFKDFASDTLMTRWSHAKYSLGVFAALMGPGDVLNVYRLSDFVGRDQTRTAALVLSGSDSAISNVGQIDALEMKGLGTPFEAVDGAFGDLQTSGIQEKWLVVLTDGKFRVPGPDNKDRDIEQSELRDLIQGFARDGADQGIRIAYLALGEDIPTVADQPRLGIYGKQARNTEDLLGQVENFANLIFGRDELPDSVFTSRNPARANIDIDMAQMIVFSQGPNIDIGPLQTNAGAIPPLTSVDVKWSPNPYQVTRLVRGQREPVLSVPDQALEGQVAYFGEVPNGQVEFAIANARSGIPTVFYRPQVRLGYQLRDVNGNEVRGNAVEAGDYTVTYGFQDVNCNFVDSPLLGKVEYLSSSIEVDGQVIATDFKSGDLITFPEGQAEISLLASYLQGTRVPGNFSPVFLKPALPSRIAATDITYQVSTMEDYPPDSAAIPIKYTIIEDGVERLPDADEWAALDASTFKVDPVDNNLEFDLKKLDEPGQLLLRARAPDGDVFKAKTGLIEATVSGSYVANRTDLYAEETVQFEVEDDLSTWDRFKNWFATSGWKWLLALLALATLLGYLFKRRFSRSVESSPEITGTPMTVGRTSINDQGSFKVNPFRRILPFFANTATLTYAPAEEFAFAEMKLKAGPGKSMVVTNWRELAERDNVAINGEQINEDTQRAPRFMPGSIITASTPQMTYELIPNVGE
jgi:hypothetical protein